jgi:hypothetical protein
MRVGACVRVFVCVRACVRLQVENETVICIKIGTLLPRDQEETLQKSECQKISLSSCPGEGYFCSSEAKHDLKKKGVIIEVICFKKEILETKITTPKKCTGFETRRRCFL